MSGLPFPLSVPVLTDGVVTLRAATPADVEPMWEMTQDPGMQRWTAVPIPNTREMSEQFALQVAARAWDDGTACMWVVEAEDDDGRPRYAGNVDLRGRPVADIGFTLHPWARGRGIMTAAVRLAVGHGFTEAGIEAVHWRSHVGNEASLRVAHACGFELVGAAPALLHERGRTLDAWTAVLRFGDAPYARRPWQDAPRLRTDRVQLRPLVEGDADRVAQACSDPTTRHWLRTLPHPYTPEVARAFVADCTWRSATGEKITWSVVDPVSDELLALVTLMHLGGVNPGTAEVGYWAHPDARGRGLVGEAVRAVTRWAFSPDGPGLHRLSLLAAAGNVASNRVAERSGFRRVGVERQAEMLGDDTLDDLVSYDLLATDEP
ncbi:GNAT family N-acetyltransferase [Aeromicrobium sp. CnD17-E]|uniref:GNAT family N-acetyltransferase n=1 Tax=Aeromicrobium sp. CnD17-E TaxID=2954487 RepID=UPI0020986550|nr:GNAT family N-acetyltransferase [Aeromicrobium sp. CnD17-E]MCO7238003.1 GNAT family N-acetyltransferase [Aeromicrobium sp. CnD17-E]